MVRKGGGGGEYCYYLGHSFNLRLLRVATSPQSYTLVLG